MAFDTTTSITSGTAQWPINVRATTIHPEPESPKALGELGAAAAQYAKAADTFIAARNALNDAKDEWQRCQALVAGVIDKEGI